MALAVKMLRLLILLVASVLGVVTGGYGDEDLHLQQSRRVAESARQESSEWIAEKTGQYLPLDLAFTDEYGSNIYLSSIVDRPTILLPIYFYCPNICSKNLANLAAALSRLSHKPGVDFRVIALSFNDAESAQDAARAKRNYLKIAGKDFPGDAWWFLTGDAAAIKTATDAIGFRYQKLDDETFIHPAALVILAGDGKIIRYVYGSFLAGDIDIALSSAQTGTVARSVRRLLDFCFNYDPDKNQSLFALVKFAVLGLFFLGIVIFLFFSFKRRKSANVE